MSSSSRAKRTAKPTHKFPWLGFLPSLSVSADSMSSCSRVHVSLGDFQSCQYLPGEFVFIVSLDHLSHDVRHIGLGSVWPDRALKQGHVQCGAVLSIGQGISEGPVLLVPLWARCLPPKPALRLFLRLEAPVGMAEDSVHQSAIEALIKREAYVYSGMKAYYAPLDTYVNVHVDNESVLGHHSSSGDGQQSHRVPRLSPELVADGLCVSFDAMAGIVDRVNRLAIYYPCPQSVVIWSAGSHCERALEDGEAGPSKSLLLTRLETELASSFVALGPQIRELVHALSETLLCDAPNPRCSGILMSGPPGSGKSALVQSVVRFFEKHGCGIAVHVLDFSARSEFEIWLPRVLAVFKRAKDQSPSLLMLEHVDALAQTHDLRLLHNVLAQLEQLSDGPGGHSVLAIGLTSRPQLVEDYFLKYNRLAVEIETILPDKAGKRALLARAFHPDCERLGLSEALLEKMAGKCVGFSGSDVLELGREMRARLLARRDSIGSQMERLSIQGSSSAAEQAFLEAHKRVKPLNAATHEWMVEVPTVHWEEIGGQEAIKQSLREAVEWPLLHPERFTRMGIRSPKGLLLYGPPGNSKTLLAKALATEANCSFMAVKGPQLLNKWVGESEKAVRSVFKKARAAAPTVLFFDEIDAIAGRRGSDGSSSASGVGDRLLTQLLVELDGIQPLLKVVFIAATNRPDILDPALLRPGRIDRLIYVPMPDASTRSEILRLQASKMAFSPTIPWHEVAERTQGYSGAELVAVAQQAGLFAMEESLSASQIEERHLLQALEKLKPRTQARLLAYYEQFRQHGRILPEL